jgi:hypothetical protein
VDCGELEHRSAWAKRGGPRFSVGSGESATSPISAVGEACSSSGTRSALRASPSARSPDCVQTRGESGQVTVQPRGAPPARSELTPRP